VRGCEAEVADFDAAVRIKEQVYGLEVTMNDALFQKLKTKPKTYQGILRVVNQNKH